MTPRQQMRQWALYWRKMVRFDDREEAVKGLHNAILFREISKR